MSVKRKIGEEFGAFGKMASNCHTYAGAILGPRSSNPVGKKIFRKQLRMCVFSKRVEVLRQKFKSFGRFLVGKKRVGELPRSFPEHERLCDEREDQGTSKTHFFETKRSPKICVRSRLGGRKRDVEPEAWKLEIPGNLPRAKQRGAGRQWRYNHHA